MVKVVVMCLVLISPAVANAQSLELYGAAGPTITDRGNSLAAGAGFSPGSTLTLVLNFERTHLSSRTSRDPLGRVVSSFRGGTLFLGTVELRYAPLGRNRLGPFGVAGLAAGVSRPNVNEVYGDSVTNRVRTMFLGGGLHVPVTENTSVFIDARMMVGSEGNEGLVAVAPLRAGMSWRF